MNVIIKELLIFIVIFILIVLLQRSNYNKNDIEEDKSIYNEYKYPLLFSSIVGLIIDLNLELFMSVKETIPQMKGGGSINTNSIESDMESNNNNEQNIYLNLPNF